MAEGDVVWTRDASNSEHEDIWDDSALIVAYDRAVGEVKEAIAKKLSDGENKKKQKPKVKPKSWKVGDFCKTIYSQDGLNYEAYIKEISESGTNCLVQYIGYGNEEVVPISALQPSLGREAREQQELLSLKEIEWIEASVNDPTPMDFQHREKPKKKLHHSHRKSKRSSVTPEPNAFYSSMQPIFHSMPPQSPHLAAHWPGSFHFSNNPQRMPPIPPPPPFPVDQDMVKDDEALAAMLMSWYMSGYHTGFYQGMKQNQSHQNCQSCKCYPHSQR